MSKKFHVRLANRTLRLIFNFKLSRFWEIGWLIYPINERILYRSMDANDFGFREKTSLHCVSIDLYRILSFMGKSAILFLSKSKVSVEKNCKWLHHKSSWTKKRTLRNDFRKFHRLWRWENSKRRNIALVKLSFT